MKSLFKLFALASAICSCALVSKIQSKEVFAAEETILNKDDFVFNVKYSQNKYDLSLDFVSEEAEKNYSSYMLEYDWKVSSISDLENSNNTCSFLDSEGKDYVYTVNIVVSIEEENESFSLNKYLQNGKEVLVTLKDPEEQHGFFLLPYFYIPVLAVVLGVGYLLCFKTNRLVGSLESTSEKLSSLLLYKEKFDKILQNQNLKENKKKKQVYRLLFKVRGHLYSIRYIIENMSMDISINNTEILDECNAVINTINTIDKKKHTLEQLTTLVNNLFEHDLTQLTNLSKKMLSTQKKYLESTYGKK